MIYIAGPVTGYEDDNRQAFEEARERLYEAGVPRFRIEKDYEMDLPQIRPGEEIVIPHDLVPRGAPWSYAMRLCVRALTQARELIYLRGSFGSYGARLETHIAHEIGIPVYSLEQYLERLGRKQE